MKKIILALLVFVASMGCANVVSAQEADNSTLAATETEVQNEEIEDVEEEGKINPKEIIFDHVGDAYGWEVPFNHHKRIPLPIIVIGTDGIHCFMSSKVEHGTVYRSGDAEFTIAGKESPYKGKVVEIVNGEEVRPWDFSITKNVAALFIAALLLVVTVLGVSRWHKQQGTRAPRKFTGAIEALTEFIYDGVIKPSLGKEAPRFATFLLTVFFFILYMNLLGLIVIFPGGANLTGNLSVTLVLALFTFFITNLFAKKHYWKEILWPDVPWWLKFPIPLMQLIEIFGLFIKPTTLTIRLFANMLSGHLVVLVLTLLISLFASFGAEVAGATAVFSVAFSLFMLLLDVLVSFIQAYVFTMLSAIFIGMGQHEEEEHKEKEEQKHAAEATK